MNHTTFSILLAAAVIGAAAASFYAYYSRTVLGSFVRRLLQKGCISPETASTFPELGLTPSRRWQHALRAQSSLSAVVKRVAPPASNKRRFGQREAPLDLSVARFYIPESALKKAEGAYAKHVGGLLSPIFTTLIFLALALLLYFFLPLFVEIPV